jgi:hypothetical protein
MILSMAGTGHHNAAWLVKGKNDYGVLFSLHPVVQLGMMHYLELPFGI